MSLGDDSEPVALPAGLDVLSSREVAEEVLLSILKALPDRFLELSVHHHVDAGAAISEQGRRAQQYVQEAIEREQEARRWWQVPKSAFPELHSDSKEDLENFCALAYWSISAEVYTDAWSPATVFSAVDAGEFAEFTLPRDIVRDLRSTFLEIQAPKSWLDLSL